MRSDFQLAVLRAKTDHDLANLFERLLQRSAQALDRGDLAVAESEYAEAAQLLPLTSGLPEPGFRALWNRLTALRSNLDKHSQACTALAS